MVVTDCVGLQVIHVCLPLGAGLPAGHSTHRETLASLHVRTGRHAELPRLSWLTWPSDAGLLTGRVYHGLTSLGGGRCRCSSLRLNLSLGLGLGLCLRLGLGLGLLMCGNGGSLLLRLCQLLLHDRMGLHPWVSNRLSTWRWRSGRPWWSYRLPMRRMWPHLRRTGRACALRCRHHDLHRWSTARTGRLRWMRVLVWVNRARTVHRKTARM